MSGSLSPTIPATPTTVQIATDVMALMAGLSGVTTDYNQGSQVRTLVESLGSVVEQQGVASQAIALQVLAYSAMSLFGIQPNLVGTFATGVATFAMAFPVSAAPAVPQAVSVPSGTLFQTNGGVQFITVAPATLASGTTSVTVGAMATQPGPAGNIAALAVSGQPLSSIGWPLLVQNAAPFGGGSPPSTPSNALALFTAKQASLGLSSPVAIANAAIGVVASGSNETVAYAAVVEPFILAGSGAGSGTAGFTLYVDNGTGSASSGLLTAVNTWISGNVTAGQSGFRPAGVPYTVASVVPVFANVAISGTLVPGLFASGTVAAAASSLIQDYFNGLGFAVPAQQPLIAAEAANAGLSAFESLAVTLTYSGSGTPVSVVSGTYNTRVILNSLTVNIGIGT
jgi:hypothetical protein